MSRPTLFKSHSFLIIISAVVFVSCGAKESSKEVKEYRLSAAKGSESYGQTIKSLVDFYNREAGFKAMEYVDSADQANSFIEIVAGLEARDGKVGWGQWLAQTEKSGMDMPGGEVSSTVTYSLQAELDKDFVHDHAGKDLVSPDLELKKLFAHEIGHGFMLDHDPDVTQVMYYDITGEKNFAPYWPKIRTFFGK